jgi:hypothetical protein
VLHFFERATPLNLNGPALDVTVREVERVPTTCNPTIECMRSAQRANQPRVGGTKYVGTHLAPWSDVKQRQ